VTHTHTHTHTHIYIHTYICRYMHHVVVQERVSIVGCGWIDALAGPWKHMHSLPGTGVWP
jgi:hypothetical protein